MSAFKMRPKEVRLAPGDVCITPGNASAAALSASREVLKGLPQWTAPPARAKDVLSLRLAYFVQVSFVEKLPLVRRVFDKLYSPQDFFMYSTDSRLLAPEHVEEALGLGVPSRRGRRRNVRVRAGPHADYSYWPRVQVVLDGFASLLSEKWDFVVHLSESDYPVHSLGWLRATLARQRNSNFVEAKPRCKDGEQKIDCQSWDMWDDKTVVASCGGEFPPKPVPGTMFPLDAMERSGFVFAHGGEWVILTRELVEYANRPDMADFKRLIGMHMGSEIFWSTLVFNIPNFTQRISEQGWYTCWDHMPNDHSPETISDQHLDEIMQHRDEYLFTRKVDLNQSANVLRALDNAGETE
mmetsp:Transcript_94274/g.272454  ORF Transcript_94274/g.272454 Transcript_94274/m.272454 type:complete len:353 (+) Transcript_94274:295-1353(+)